MSRKAAGRVAAFGLIGVLVAIAVACGGGGVSQSDYDKVKQQAEDSEAEANQLQTQVASLQAKPTTAPETKAAGGAGLIAAVSVTPRPTNTPLPAGSTPPTAAPRETAPASYYEKAGDYFIYVETIATTTASKYNVASTLACTPSSVFARGQRIVWRYEILDVNTGKRITDKDTGVTVKVVLPNGDESAGRFSQRAGGSVPGAPFMWSSNWDIPLDYPLGGIDYKIVITKDGKAVTWKLPSLVSPTIDTKPKVVQ
ncbi:MAG: hypothetical protein HY875_05285 [Chloroflexi bacterium]|nr:hypothetical protein [Chloroflexota bacterium]